MKRSQYLGHLAHLRKCAGYTLIEAFITMAILTILAGAATPSLISVISSNKVAVQSKKILESLQLARNTAIVNNSTVHICQIDSVDELKCSDNYASNRSWSEGWLVFVDNNQNNNYDAEDELIRQVAAVKSTGLVFNQRGRLRFFHNGSARSAGFTVCDMQKKHYRHIYLLHTGRTRVSHELNKKQQGKCDSVAQANKA